MQRKQGGEHIRRADASTPPPRVKTPGCREAAPCAGPGPPRQGWRRPIQPAQAPERPGDRRRGPSLRTGPGLPQPGVQPGAEPPSGACVCLLRASRCLCVSVSACVPKCGRQPVYVGPVLAWKTLGAGRIFLRGRGGWRGAREPRGEVGTKKEREDAGRRRGGTSQRAWDPARFS